MQVESPKWAEVAHMLTAVVFCVSFARRQRSQHASRVARLKPLSSGTC